MTIYTVTSLDDLARCAMDRCTVGSYTTRGKALDEAVDYLVGRLALRDDLAYSMAHDENHQETAGLFCEGRDGVWKLRRGSKRKLKACVRDELGGQGCYYIYDGKCQVDLDDGCSVSCVLYHTDAKNIKE